MILQQKYAVTCDGRETRFKTFRASFEANVVKQDYQGHRNPSIYYPHNFHVHHSETYRYNMVTLRQPAHSLFFEGFRSIFYAGLFSHMEITASAAKHCFLEGQTEEQKIVMKIGILLLQQMTQAEQGRGKPFEFNIVYT